MRLVRLVRVDERAWTCWRGSFSVWRREAGVIFRDLDGRSHPCACIVPNGCSTVSRRWRRASGLRQLVICRDLPHGMSDPAADALVRHLTLIN